jgi:hypothetical protein
MHEAVLEPDRDEADRSAAGVRGDQDALTARRAPEFGGVEDARRIRMPRMPGAIEDARAGVEILRRKIADNEARRGRCGLRDGVNPVRRTASWSP